MERRVLKLENFPAVLQECQRLLDDGYRKGGQWSLGQICWHMRLTMDAHRQGYPLWMSLFAPVRPFFRKFLLPRLLAGDSPAGLKTASIFQPPESVEDAGELRLLQESIVAFQKHQSPLKPHPGFGRLRRTDAETFHAAHAAHHLSFLLPACEDRSEG